jgi:thiol-disulfide isomerase/thioredoxin
MSKYYDMIKWFNIYSAISPINLPKEKAPKSFIKFSFIDGQCLNSTSINLLGILNNFINDSTIKENDIVIVTKIYCDSCKEYAAKFCHEHEKWGDKQFYYIEFCNYVWECEPKMIAAIFYHECVHLTQYVHYEKDFIKHNNIRFEKEAFLDEAKVYFKSFDIKTVNLINHLVDSVINVRKNESGLIYYDYNKDFEFLNNILGPTNFVSHRAFLFMILVDEKASKDIKDIWDSEEFWRGSGIH